MLKKSDYMTQEEIRYERNERRKELEEYRDRYNAYYFGYANIPTSKEARHLHYMKYRDAFYTISETGERIILII